MIFLKKPLVLLFLLMGGLAALLIELNRPNAEPLPPARMAMLDTAPAQSELMSQLESIKDEKTAALTKVTSLEAEVRQLKKQLALHDRRGREGAHEKQTAALGGGDSPQSAPEETPFAKSVLELAIKAGRLNAQIQQYPERDIPELQYVDEGEWIHLAKHADLDSEEGLSKAMAELRKTAKTRFADFAREALSNFAKANGGQAPLNLSQLIPYLPDSITPALLDRYQLAPGNSPDIGGPMILREKASVDPRYDTNFGIGPNGWTSTTTGTGYIVQ